MFAALLGTVSGALKPGIEILRWILEQLKKYSKLLILLVGWGFVFYASSAFIAFTVYHAVGLLCVVVGLFVTSFSIQTVVLAGVSLVVLVFTIFGSKLIPG